MAMMRFVQGKGESPTYYYNLCKCYPPEFSHPPSGITGKDLIIAVENGCLVCTLVKDALIASIENIDETYKILHKLKNNAIKIRCMEDKKWESQLKLQVYPSQGQKFPFLNLDPMKEVHSDPLSENCIQRMKEMLDFCKRNHPRCRVESTLPLRVIEVGPEPKLYCTNGENAEYVALSHCWGSTQNLTTTTSSLAKRIEGIPWDDIPKTFQDAILLTRELGFAYIWIDSLCILQDDHDEWERESMKMGQIYECASITLAASLSEADADGFLRPRTKHISTAFNVTHTALEFRVRTAIGKHTRHDVGSLIRDSWRANLIGPASPMEPLDHRAWAFQEKLVSRRLLSFCNKEIEWDCISGSDCECGARCRDFESQGWDTRNGSSRQIYQSLKQGSSQSLRGRNSAELSIAMMNSMKGMKPEISSPDQKHHALTLWRMQLVPTYSQLKLTKDMDRLPALSAVARGLRSICGDYVAGMWCADLEVAIAWKAGPYGTFDPQPGRFPSKYRAPSWSWAAIEGAVDFCYDHEDQYDQICFVESVYGDVGLDPFSNMTSARLKVQGHLLSGSLKLDIEACKANPGEFRFGCEIDGEMFPVLPDRPLTPPDSGIDLEADITIPIYLFAVLMAVPRKNTGFVDDGAVIDFEVNRWITFLVLIDSKVDDSNDVYCRTGVIRSASSNRLPADWYKRWPMVSINII